MSYYAANPYDADPSTGWHEMTAEELPLTSEERGDIKYFHCGITVYYEARVTMSGYVEFRNIRLPGVACVNGRAVESDIELDRNGSLCRSILSTLDASEASIREALHEMESA
jgi:hypothetical protein